MDTKNLGRRLKELRAIRGMSQEYLAEESKVSLRTIQRIENNESEPTGETIKRIANALDIPLTELTGANTIAETNDLRGTIIYLKKQLSKTNERSEIKTFENFIGLLERLKQKDLSPEQMEGIESYIQYLELEKIPSFSNDLFKPKLAKFKKYLKKKLGLVPTNHYTTLATVFGISFASAFAVQAKIDNSVKFGVFAVVILVIALSILMDLRIKKQNRSLRF